MLVPQLLPVLGHCIPRRGESCIISIKSELYLIQGPVPGKGRRCFHGLLEEASLPLTVLRRIRPSAQAPGSRSQDTSRPRYLYKSTQPAFEPLGLLSALSKGYVHLNFTLISSSLPHWPKPSSSVGLPCLCDSCYHPLRTSKSSLLPWPHGPPAPGPADCICSPVPGVSPAGWASAPAPGRTQQPV